MIDRVRSFLRSRWDHLRNDRISQIILLACLLSFPPAFYYGQLLLRALLLAVLIFFLLLRSTLNSWSKVVGARLDPALPPPVAFYRLFLRDLEVQTLVASARWFININICFLLLNNPLWLPVVDVFLGGCFFLVFATADELHIRGSPVPGRPVDPSGAPGGGWRTSFDYFMGHAQKNPRRTFLLTALGAGLGYVGKSLVDGVVQDRVNANQTVRQAASDVETARRIGEQDIFVESQKAKIRLDEKFQEAKIRLDEDSRRFQLQLQQQKELNALELHHRQALAALQGGDSSSFDPPKPAGLKKSMDEPDLYIQGFPTQL